MSNICINLFQHWSQTTYVSWTWWSNSMIQRRCCWNSTSPQWYVSSTWVTWLLLSWNIWCASGSATSCERIGEILACPQQNPHTQKHVLSRVIMIFINWFLARLAKINLKLVTGLTNCIVVILLFQNSVIICKLLLSFWQYHIQPDV